MFSSIGLAVSRSNFDEDFDFKVRFDTEEADQFVLDGQVDGLEIRNFRLSIVVNKFQADFIDEVDVSIRGDGVNEELNENDKEIRTLRDELVVDLDNERFDLRDTIDFDIRVEDDDGDTENFEFTIRFDVDSDQFEIEIENMDFRIRRTSVEVAVDNRNFDSGDPELDIDIDKEDEIRISFEGDFEDLDFDILDGSRSTRTSIRDRLEKVYKPGRELGKTFVSSSRKQPQTSSLRSYYTSPFAYTVNPPTVVSNLVGSHSTTYLRSLQTYSGYSPYVSALPYSSYSGSLPYSSYLYR